MPGASFEGSGFGRQFSKKLVKNRVEFSRCNLRDANLSALNLQKARLTDCDLSGADFSSSDLSGAELARSILFNAVLEDAKMTGTDLRGCQLPGFDMRLLRDYSGLMIGADQQAELLRTLGLDVHPE